MASGEAKEAGRHAGRWRAIGWSIPVILLLLPFVANAPWTLSDFIVAGLLLGSVGLAFEFIFRRSNSPTYRLGAAVVVIAAFLTVWVNGAVGMIGPEGNPYNFIFGGVLLTALIGVMLARLEPAGMMRAMLVTAIAQALAGAIGLTTDVLGAVLSMGFAGLWLISAAFFRNAQREQALASPAP